MSTSATDIQGLFGNAVASGNMTPEAQVVLSSVDLGQQIQAGFGVVATSVDASEVLLVTLVVDDSTSIRSTGNEQIVRDGVNLVLKSLKDSKQRDNIFVMIVVFNNYGKPSNVIVPYTHIDDVPYLDATNYRANGGTPLYDMDIKKSAMIIAKMQEFADCGVTARGVALMMSDGADYGSNKKPSDAATANRSLLSTEQHIMLAMGIDDSERDAQGNVVQKGTDFRKVFSSMGYRPECILTPGNTESELRAAFMVVSQSAVRASQGAKGFSQAAASGAGGFTG